MTDPVVKILLIDDDEDDFILARALLSEISGVAFEVDWIQDYDQALAVLAGPGASGAPHRPPYDACLVDFRLGEKDGIALIREAKQRAAALPIILLTGQGDHEVDLAAMNAGAADFLDKSQLTAGILERALRYAIHSAKVESQRARLLAVAEQQAAQLRHLATELTQAEQRERRRVAQSLHDHLQQLLVAAKMRIDRLQTRTADQKLRHAVTQVQELISESIEASRSLTVQLSPPVLHDRGLIPALEWLSRQFGKEHDLAVDVVADQPLEVIDDHLKDFIFQAVRELLFNVVKHADAGEAVITVSRTDDDLHVTVRDNGKGCDPKHIARQSSENGFGLFHLQQRLEFLGGRFGIGAPPDGPGCEVRVTVPMLTDRYSPAATGRAAPDAASDAPEKEPGRAGAPAPAAVHEPGNTDEVDAVDDDVRVLLVDDHKILREGLAGLLREHPGIQVVGEASDGRMAIDLCQRLHPDVVVMDISMPGMSGIDATRAITRECPGIRVIGLSMHETSDVADAMRDAGAAAYFPKGDPSDGLINAIVHRTATETVSGRP